MIYFGKIREGFGNKLFMLLSHINVFKKAKGESLYILECPCKHDRHSDRFQLIFPHLNEIPWLHFVDQIKYDSLKGTEMKQPSFLKEDFLELSSFIKKYFKMNEKYEKLLDKYDTKKGIAVHVRLGDKFQENYRQIKDGKKETYLLMSPKYYIDKTQEFLSEKNGPVYLFTDSIKFAECFLKPGLTEAIIVEEDFPESFFLLTKFKRAVISESTFSIAAHYMNFLKHEFIIPSYRLTPSKGNLIDSPYVNSSFRLEDDKSYKLEPSEYSPILKRCYSSKK
jgi:hypothetical protein